MFFQAFYDPENVILVEADSLAAAEAQAEPGWQYVEAADPALWPLIAEARTRLEELRAALRAENMSYGELAELQSLVAHIEAGDLELLEAAGVPEEEAGI